MSTSAMTFERSDEQAYSHCRARFESRFGGALVADDGSEVPITRQLIDAACEQLQASACHGLTARQMA